MYSHLSVTIMLMSIANKAFWSWKPCSPGVCSLEQTTVAVSCAAIFEFCLSRPFGNFLKILRATQIYRRDFGHPHSLSTQNQNDVWIIDSGGDATSLGAKACGYAVLKIHNGFLYCVEMRKASVSANWGRGGHVRPAWNT